MSPLAVMLGDSLPETDTGTPQLPVVGGGGRFDTVNLPLSNMNILMPQGVPKRSILLNFMVQMGTGVFNLTSPLSNYFHFSCFPEGNK